MKVVISYKHHFRVSYHVGCISTYVQWIMPIGNGSDMETVLYNN